jgi:alcohol dehydrogenase class IV
LGGEDLPSTLREIMDAVGIPAGLKAVGYTAADIPDLVEGALAQQRLLALAPLKVSAADLAHVFRESL